MKEDTKGMPGDDGVHPAPESRDPIALVHAFAKALAEYKAHIDV